MAIEDGGPAFPIPLVYDGQAVTSVLERGMSMRQWYAGQAMKGLLANTTFNHFAVKGGRLVGGAAAQDVADEAGRMADAMIAADKAIEDQ